MKSIFDWGIVLNEVNVSRVLFFSAKKMLETCGNSRAQVKVVFIFIFYFW